MNRFRQFGERHPIIVKCVVLGYLVFMGCFAFPLWSEEFPFDFIKGYSIVVGYGIIALGLAGIYGAKKEKRVYVLALGFTAIGLLCRYALEFGEYSNTYNFTPFNIALYSLIVPLFTMTAYHFIAKQLVKHSD